MQKVVTAAEANRRFSELLRDVRGGESYLITSHGKPVAEIVPVAADEVARKAAQGLLFQRLQKQKTGNVGRWRRDDLYEP